ncbi:MAG: hypothetical protein KDD39_12490 [Bdellovibrionales bacterium]|nr:hypothetical protein [Bdellovibrionales bacterium]
MRPQQYVKNAFAILILSLPLTFAACGRGSAGLFFANGSTFGGGFTNTNSGNSNTNTSGSIDISSLGTSDSDKAAQDAFFDRCSALGDVAFQIAGFCGPLVNSLWNPSLEEPSLLQQFRSQIQSCHTAFNIMYEPYCYSDLQTRMQNAIRTCVNSFVNAPWQQIYDSVTNPQTVNSQAVQCANGLKSLK